MQNHQDEDYMIKTHLEDHNLMIHLLDFRYGRHLIQKYSRHCGTHQLQFDLNQPVNYCRNPTLAKCEDETHTPKVEDLESSGTPECLEFDSRGQNTLDWGVLGVIGKLLKCRCPNGLELVIWTSSAQVMSKRRAGSQTASLTPDHKKSGIDLFPTFAAGV